MNRVLKFRAWDSIEAQMREVQSIDLQLKKVFVAIVENGNNLGWRWEHFPEKVHLMQFTGLTDVKGREIYEGDILSGGDVYGPWVVVWELDGWALKDGCALHAALGGKEVIGNIYENPDLLSV